MRALKTALSFGLNTSIPDNMKILSVLRRKKVIFPEEVSRVLPRGSSPYSEEDLRFLSETLPGKVKLEKIAKSNWPLIPGPPRPMSLLEVRNHLPRCFNLIMGGWFEKPGEYFSREEKVESGWLVFRTDRYQQRYSKALLPNAAEIAWYAGIYTLLRTTRVLHGMAMSSSCASSKTPVSVGYHAGTAGLHVCCYPPDLAFAGVDFIKIFKRSI